MEVVTILDEEPSSLELGEITEELAASNASRHFSQRRRQ